MNVVNARGFSMVELLVALGLGLVITAGIVQLFVGNDRTQSILVGQSHLQESARYAFDFIGRSVRAAGYFGCAPPEPGESYINTLNEQDWGKVFEADITTPIQAYDYSGGGGTNYADWKPEWEKGDKFVDGVGVDPNDIAPRTDILVVRRIEAPGHRLTAPTSPDADPVVLRFDGALTIEADDFAVIANCEQAAVFRVIDVVVNGNEAALDRTAGKSGKKDSQGSNFGNSGDPLSISGLSYGSVVDSQGATVGRVVTDVYYIGRGAGVDNRGAPVMALWRRSGIDAAIELVEGVTDLQILFGVDTDATDNLATINQYMDFDAIGPNDVIRTVRVEITASSVDVLADAAQPALRTFSQTINLRNAL